MTKEEFIKMIPAIEDIGDGCVVCINNFLYQIIEINLIEKEWAHLVKQYTEDIKLLDVIDYL